MNMDNRGVGVPMAAVARQMVEDARRDMEAKGEELMAKIGERANGGFDCTCGAIGKPIADRYVEALENAGYNVEVVEDEGELDWDPYDPADLAKNGITEDEWDDWDPDTEVLLLVDWKN